jgi:ABC-type lipoprotein export system ATPase subunit
MQLLDELHGDGATLITVTHNPVYAERASRRIHMLDGQLQSGRDQHAGRGESLAGN